MLERYFKTYGVVRLDFGDVIVPFGNAALNVGRTELMHPGTTHNFQVTVGVGARF